MNFHKKFALLFTGLLLLVQGGFTAYNLGKLNLPYEVNEELIREAEGSTKAMLDAAEQLMTGGSEFDPDYFELLWSCMASVTPTLQMSSDLAWYGMITYSDQNGVPGDEWGDCLGTGHCIEYFEQNATAQAYHNITIYEPCNYASNFAYYHITTQVCNRTQIGDWNLPQQYVGALGEIFAHHAMGSAFWHGSHTTLGNIFDNRGIEIFAWIAYQAMIENLPNGGLAVVKDLQNETRPFTAIEINDQLTQMFLTSPVEEWTEIIVGLNMPNYWMSFAAIVVTILTLAVEEQTADSIIWFLKDLFSFPEEEFDFIYYQLLPELRNGTADLNIGLIDKLHIEGNFGSTLIKLVYAFVWQEWVITSNETLFTPEANELGWQYVPIVNGFANGLNNFEIYDEDLQDGINLFPGEEWCQIQNPHSKWHTQSAAGLTDLLFLTDDIYRIIINALP